MRTLLTRRSGLAGWCGTLVLALALSACGAPDDGGDSAGTPGADAATVATTAAATPAADTCAGPPPAFSTAVMNGPWQALIDSLAAHAVSFPEISGNDTTTTVKLCPACTRVRVAIRASNLTPCLKPDDLSGAGQRITGLFIVLDAFPAQHGWDALSPGDSLFAFTNSVNGPATLVYNQNGSGKPSPSRAWMFYYCQDGHTNPKTPQAQWRPRDTALAARTPERDKDKGKGKDEDGDGDGGTYGWMACASGCCQFYTPPPNAMVLTTAEQANANAPDTVGPGIKPSWCTAGT